MSLIYLSKPPNSEFNRYLFEKLCLPLEDAQCFFGWGAGDYGINIELVSSHPLANPFKFIEQNIKKPLTILWFLDYLVPVAKNVEEFLLKNIDKKFIFVTSMGNFKLNAPNCIVVEGPHDLTHQWLSYPFVPAVLDKNFDSDKIFISLSRNKRMHRVALVMLLLGMNMEKYGTISFLSTKGDVLNHLDKEGGNQWFERLDHSGYLKPQMISEIIEHGQSKFIDHKFDTLDNWDSVYSRIAVLKKENATGNDNVGNYLYNLISLYKNSFVEIINETSGYEGSAAIVSEKTLNSIYGCNFPIFNNNPLMPNMMKNLGLDIFEDIVNHDYQYETNMYSRVWKLIEMNKELLTNADRTKELWLRNKHRFERNVEFARKELYEVYENRTENQFKDALKRLNTSYAS